MRTDLGQGEGGNSLIFFEAVMRQSSMPIGADRILIHNTPLRVEMSKRQMRTSCVMIPIGMAMRGGTIHPREVLRLYMLPATAARMPLRRLKSRV